MLGGSKKDDESKKLTEQRAQIAAEDKQIKDLQAQTDEVTKVMQENIQLVIDRGEKIETLQKESEELTDEAKEFKKTATRLRWYEELRNVTLTIVLIGMCLGAGYAAVQGFSLTAFAGCTLLAGVASYALGRIAVDIFQFFQRRTQVLDAAHAIGDLTQEAELDLELDLVFDANPALAMQYKYDQKQQPVLRNMKLPCNPHSVFENVDNRTYNTTLRA